MALFTPFFTACAPAKTTSAAPNDTKWIDGTRLAELISQGETTSLEATEAAIARAEAVNPKINAIATKTFEEARATAAATPEGSFGGVPSFIKDLMDWKGAPTMYGSRAFKENVVEADGAFASKWREAGMVVLGKSTTPEMGLISSTEPLVTGATRNPWNTDHIPGGSSGGAAALTAARVTPFCHASDGGGSIRIPAACCGLFGLKPSRGRLQGSQMAPPPVDISVNHAVTLTVRDSAALFTAAESNNGKFEPIGNITGPATRRLKIAYAPEPVNAAAVSSDVRTALDATAQLCRDLGHEVIDYKVPLNGDKFSDQFLLYWSAAAAEFAQDASKFTGKPPSPEILEPWTLGLAMEFIARADEIDDVVAYLQAFEGIYHSWFDDFDVLLSPTVTSTAPAIGTQDPAGDYATVRENVLNFAAYTAPMNVSGGASMSVPLFEGSDGLPIGSMFSGQIGDDGLLLALAYELEEAKPWIGRMPTVHG